MVVRILLTLLVAVGLSTALLYGGGRIVKLLLRRRGSSLRRESRRKRKILLQGRPSGSLVVGFFHPYCNAGGGGERVLWAAVRATQRDFPLATCAVYTGDVGVDKAAMVARAKDAFGITVDAEALLIVHLTKRHLVAPETWPRFTLIGQSLGALPLAYEAVGALVPDVFIDTMGYAFTYPLVKLLLEIPVATYTHYPTISSDMLCRVTPANLPKLAYWRAFATLYSVAGSYADLVMCNSTWTANHIRSLWSSARSLTPGSGGGIGGVGGEDVSVVYPPCDTQYLSDSISPLRSRRKDIVCVAQFRREKDHITLLKAFRLLRERHAPAHDDARLRLIGTVRNDIDRAYIASLKSLAHDVDKLALPREAVSFETDVPWPLVVSALGVGWVGANAMRDEHFGIGVVEYMAAGLIACVHDSAGPKLDIVTPYQGGRTGYHATDANSFADAFHSALSLPKGECEAMRTRAQRSAARFSEEVFETAWNERMAKLMRLEKKCRLERQS